jgi:hypothetical protein
MEHSLIVKCEAIIANLVVGLAPDNHALAAESACSNETKRGFDYVTHLNVAAQKRRGELLARFGASQPGRLIITRKATASAGSV